MVLHDKDLYQENDAFVHHHYDVQLHDFHKTLNQVQYGLVDYKKSVKILSFNESTNFAAISWTTFPYFLSGFKSFVECDTGIMDADGTSPFAVS